MGSDLQDPPELIPKLMEKFRSGAEIVHTTRTERE
jgi:polyisoprenyl-phosphate glycosyltransferase